MKALVRSHDYNVQWYKAICFYKDRKDDDHEEVELMLEGFRADLQEIMTELRSFHSQIEDTREFINTYQVKIFSTFLSIHFSSDRLSEP